MPLHDSEDEDDEDDAPRRRNPFIDDGAEDDEAPPRRRRRVNSESEEEEEDEAPVRAGCSHPTVDASDFVAPSSEVPLDAFDPIHAAQQRAAIGRHRPNPLFIEEDSDTD